MNAPITVSQAIEEHRAAFVFDESRYDDDSNPIVDNAAIKASSDAEIAALRAFAKAPCLTHDEVQEKLRYFHTGKAAGRLSIFAGLVGHEYASDDDPMVPDSWGFELLMEFMRTLVLDSEKQA